MENLEIIKQVTILLQEGGTKFKYELIKVIKSNTSTFYFSFNVSSVFGHRIEGLVPQYIGDNYRNWLFTPNQYKTLIVPKTLPKLVDYKLPKKMNDTTIQNENKSTPMDEETFLITLYLLIIKPELGKALLGYELKQDGTYYILHVKMADGTVRAVSVRWFADGWCCLAYSFDEYGGWSQGTVFLHFATV